MNAASSSSSSSSPSSLVLDHQVAASLAARGKKIYTNHGPFFAADALKSESARVDANFMSDFTELLAGGRHCFALKNFVVDDHRDHSLMRGILKDLEAWQATTTSQPSDQQQQNKTSRISNSERESASTGPQSKAMTGAVCATLSVHRAMTKDELELDKLKDGFVAWSQHEKFENPDISPTFNSIVAYMAQYFSLDILATRMNLYRDGQAWKTWHHDRNAFSDRCGDFTVGCSFGGTRDLAFKSMSGRIFAIPQESGDCFAFTNDVNKKFMHGVPRSNAYCGPRISIIVWGCRKSLNPRNGGVESVPANLFSKNAAALAPVRMNEDGSMCGAAQNMILDAAKSLLAADVAQRRQQQQQQQQQQQPGDEDDSENAGIAGSAGVTKPKKKKNRLQ